MRMNLKLGCLTSICCLSLWAMDGNSNSPRLKRRLSAGDINYNQNKPKQSSCPQFTTNEEWSPSAETTGTVPVQTTLSYPLIRFLESIATPAPNH